jgi:hypothetical protein
MSKLLHNSLKGQNVKRHVQFIEQRRSLVRYIRTNCLADGQEGPSRPDPYLDQDDSLTLSELLEKYDGIKIPRPNKPLVAGIEPTTKQYAFSKQEAEEFLANAKDPTSNGKGGYNTPKVPSYITVYHLEKTLDAISVDGLRNRRIGKFLFTISEILGKVLGKRKADIQSALALQAFKKREQLRISAELARSTTVEPVASEATPTQKQNDELKALRLQFEHLQKVNETMKFENAVLNKALKADEPEEESSDSSSAEAASEGAPQLGSSSSQEDGDSIT